MRLVATDRSGTGFALEGEGADIISHATQTYEP
jgi:hypothetical protein